MENIKLVDTAISKVLPMIRSNCKAEEALKFSQAALNLAHVRLQLLQTTDSKGSGS